MTYAIDPELQQWLPMLPAISLENMPAIRAMMNDPQVRAQSFQMPTYEPATPVTVEERLIPGPAGAPEVRVRVYTPTGVPGPLPGFVSIHGGGFVVGDLDQDVPIATRIAAEAAAVVVSVDYRLAPEHPYPAGLEDCYAALEWTAAKASELGVDSSRIGIGGVSAGGGLAAALALLARDRGGPAVCFQFLAIPELDDRLETPSMTRFVDTPMWNRPNAVLSWKYYLGGQLADQYAAPSRAEDLSGLPPAYVSVCEFDPLRDEGLAYATRLIQAGVPTELHLFPGTFHGSELVATAAVSQRMSAESVAAIRRALS
ncbi:alpha/beta hydrolase [Kutzneria buriramensis]|uniref:Acetyl esterase/lipase n=1 Tax=Kutzneria buriramensis TaxID=1045776 RepID=A0A3E0HGK0_9PSEU|nr:alpha/beta hydrolase [Kutzneria buriramensis]REH44912.1 acetyl esterase/lipase [Kutzneria buriramensis]